MSWGILPYIVGMAVGEFFWPSKKEEVEKKPEEEKTEAKAMEVKKEDFPEHLRIFDRY